MGWEIAADNDIPSLLDFLHHRESACVSLTSRLVKPLGIKGKQQFCLPAQEDGRLVMYRDHTPDHTSASAKSGKLPILALVYIETTGFSFPIFSSRFSSNGDDAVLFELLRPYLAQGFSIMGMKADCDRYMSMTGTRAFHRVEYYLMERLTDRGVHSIEYSGDNICCRAVPADAPRLLDLQIAYEEEEVVIPGRRVNRAFTLRMLQNSLHSQRVLFIHEGGYPLAKAQTNARGMTAEQIGGVYTRPARRGEGHATTLVEMLAREINAEGKTAALFVKTSNPGALKVYEKCGFLSSGRFSIVYL